MALNPCELEIDLFCRGIRIPQEVSLDGARGISRTRAGLGDGLEVTIPTGSWLKKQIWVNIPVEEQFAKQSPYVLTGSPEDGYRIHDELNDVWYPIDVPRQPAWYTRTTSRGIPMNRIGVLQGTYLGIYVNMVCTFWNYSPALNCRFCTTGNNVGEHEVVDKAVEDVIETARAAKEQSGVTFVHLNAGFQGNRGVQFAEPYIAALKELGEPYEEIADEAKRTAGQGNPAAPQKPAVTKIELINTDARTRGKTDSSSAAYMKAFGLYSANKYPEAIEAFTDFLRKYPDAEYAVNAQYWIGECYYSRSDLPKALESFRTVIAKYPYGKKVPDAMLKTGYTLSAMKETEKARSVFESLIVKFPESTAAAKARERLASY